MLRNGDPRSSAWRAISRSRLTRGLAARDRHEPARLRERGSRRRRARPRRTARRARAGASWPRGHARTPAARARARASGRGRPGPAPGGAPREVPRGATGRAPSGTPPGGCGPRSSRVTRLPSRYCSRAPSAWTNPSVVTFLGSPPSSRSRTETTVRAARCCRVSARSCVRNEGRPETSASASRRFVLPCPLSPTMRFTRGCSSTRPFARFRNPSVERERISTRPTTSSSASRRRDSSGCPPGVLRGGPGTAPARLSRRGERPSFRPLRGTARGSAR